MNKQARTNGKKKLWTLFRHAEDLAALHDVLSSANGDYFYLRLLQRLETERSLEELEQFRLDVHLEEIRRHLNKLLGFGLIGEHSADGCTLYERSDAGEKAVGQCDFSGNRCPPTHRTWRPDFG